MTAERLQKFMAGAGVASRRHAEALILAGRVKVNERTVTELGTKIDPERDLVRVDGRLIERSAQRAYYLLYKPPGCVTTASDPEGRPTALEYLRGVPERVFPVGRLDWDAEGAVLFTDDGELANRLAHPRYGHRRVYLVKVKGEPEPEQLARMRSGLRLEDGPAQALELDVHEQAEKNTWLRIVVGEGRYHLVKRLCEAVGLYVLRLFRPEFGGVSVVGLRPGRFRALSSDELRAMKASVGLGTAGGKHVAPAPLPRMELPRAARRHGHGPPAPPDALDRSAGPRQAEESGTRARAGSGPGGRSGARGGDGEGATSGTRARSEPGSRSPDRSRSPSRSQSRSPTQSRRSPSPPRSEAKPRRRGPWGGGGR